LLANAQSEAAVVENLGLVGSGEFRFGNLEGLNAQAKAALENPALLAYKLQTNAYKFSWGLIPLSLPFLWLMFAWRREFKIYDHAIFVTYSLCFISLLVVTLALAAEIPGIGGPVVALGVFYVPVHMYRQLKGAYVLSTGSAAWRTAVLVISATTVLTIAAILLLIKGVAD
jgi:type IV secretory pathway TraG/TraD family ATPase VirD4